MMNLESRFALYFIYRDVSRLGATHHHHQQLGMHSLSGLHLSIVKSREEKGRSFPERGRGASPVNTRFPCLAMLT